MHGVMRKDFAPYFIAAVLSVILSCFVAVKTSIINPDAICYLQSAAAMERGFAVAAHLCEQAKWPFYSALIFGLTKLTHLTYLSTAYLLNGFFSLLSVLTFIAIVHTLTKSKRIIWLAAAVILLAHGFNTIRVEIVRDHGFWVFYLISLWLFVCYFQLWNLNTRIKQRNVSLLWGISLIIASLFRIEGVLFLILLPFTVFFKMNQTFIHRVKAFLQLNYATLFVLVILIIWIVTHPVHQLGRLTEVQFQLLHGFNQFINSIQTTSAALKAHVLNGFSAHDVNTIMLSMWVGYYVANVISSVSIIYAILIGYAWLQKLSGFKSDERLAIWAYIIVNVIVTAIFLAENMFLSKRYLIALSLVLMLWVPFALNTLILHWRVRKWPLLLATLVIIIYAVGGIFDFGYSKKYIRDAGDWLAYHTPNNSKIYSNDYQLLYYSQRMGNEIFTLGHAFENLKLVQHGAWQYYDFLAVQVLKNASPDAIALLQEIHLSPIKVFQNERGDQVLIYQVHLRSENVR